VEPTFACFARSASASLQRSTAVSIHARESIIGQGDARLPALGERARALLLLALCELLELLLVLLASLLALVPSCGARAQHASTRHDAGALVMAATTKKEGKCLWLPAREPKCAEHSPRCAEWRGRHPEARMTKVHQRRRGPLVLLRNYRERLIAEYGEGDEQAIAEADDDEYVFSPSSFIEYVGAPSSVLSIEPTAFVFTLDGVEHVSAKSGEDLGCVTPVHD
jgi:hypothetical protein